jgi:predicted  nucleic acid-binding Zn-ribbon protein
MKTLTTFYSYHPLEE